MTAVTAIGSGVFQVAASETGTIDLTISGLGFTPDGVLAFWSGGSTYGTAVANANLGMGFCDNSLQNAVSFTAQDALGTTITQRAVDDDFAIKYVTGDTSADIMALDAVVDVSAGPISDGWRFAITKAGTPEDMIVVLIYFSGTDIVVTADLDSVTAPTIGFQANTSWWCNIASSTIDGTAAQAALSMGVSYFNGSSVENYAVGFGSQSGQATTEVNTYVDNDDCNMQVFNDSQGWASDVTAYNATTLTKTDGGGGDRIFGIHINLDSSISFKAGIVDSPTSAGSDWDQSATLSFTPSVLGLIMNMADSVNTVETGAPAGVTGVALTDFTINGCVTAADEDAVGTSNSQSLGDDQFVNLAGSDGTQEFDFDSPDADTNGWTVTAANITTANSTARKWLYFAFGTVSAAVTPEIVVPHEQRSYRHSGRFL